MLAGGTAVLVTGGIVALGAFSFVGIGLATIGATLPFCSGCSLDWTQIHQALVVGASGLTIAAAGIPLVAIGAKRVPIREPSFWDPPAVKVEAAAVGLRVRW